MESAGSRPPFVAAGPAPPDATGTAALERRQLTVVFCDLVSFTRLSQRLDPEDLRSVVHEYYGICGTICRRFEGYVANHLGDGLLILFGYPRAHEDDAQRAVQASLTIIEAIAATAFRIPRGEPVHLSVRVGIHTGLAIIGQDAGGNWERMALGDTLNLASRIQGLAEPNCVVISDSTHQLVRGLFECRKLGARDLKGIDKPVELHQVLHESAARSRLEILGQAGELPPLVGRRAEMALLLELWQAAREGSGRVVLITGEPGIGKSRLTAMLKQHAAQSSESWLTPCQCSPHHQHTALHPVRDLLERVVLRFERHLGNAGRLARMEGLLLQYGLPPREVLPAFASLLSLPLPPELASNPVSPDQQRRQIFEAFLHILTTRSRRQPLLFVVEDLQWADPTTLELLDEVVARASPWRVLTVFTARPEFPSRWTDHPRLVQLPLGRLSRGEVELLVQQITHGGHFPPELVEQVAFRTDGVPIFVEELTKMMVESGLVEEHDGQWEVHGALPDHAIPTTLHGSLMARLDRLSTVKEVAQVAATLGREFSYELVRVVSQWDDHALVSALHQLVQAGLLFQQGAPPDAKYVFKHALIQETAYQSLLRSRRRKYHHRVAAALREHFPELVDAQPEILAYHFLEAGESDQALPYWEIAGDKAAEHSAHKEAIRHYSQGLEILRGLPPGTFRQEREIRLHLKLGAPLAAARGYGAREVEETYSRARELSEGCGTPSERYLARYGLWRLHMLRAQYEIARAEGQELLRLAESERKPSFLVAAHRALGSTLFYLGEFEASRRHVEEVLHLTAADQADTRMLIRDVYDVVDPRVTCHSYLSWNLWMLGAPDQALTESERAIHLAAELRHPFSMALALSFGAWLRQFRREPSAVAALAREALALAESHRFPFWIGWDMAMEGWARQDDGTGSGTDPVERIARGLRHWIENGSQLGRGYFLALLAETQADTRQFEVARQSLADARDFGRRTGERFWEAEQVRLEGDFLLRAGRTGDSGLQPGAEERFIEAIELADRIQARSLALRATVSLARLPALSGRGQAIAANLGERYRQFGEGLETIDLQEARALLA